MGCFRHLVIGLSQHKLITTCKSLSKRRVSMLRPKNNIPNEYSNPPLRAMGRLRPYMVDKIKECMKLLIEDSSLRQRIGREAATTIENGEFSLKNRNALLKEIFDNATS